MPITTPRIYLTAGHQVINGKGTGAQSPYGDEAVLALELRDMIAAVLREFGHQVITEVPTDALSTVIRWLRPIVTSKDIVIDIHFNSAANVQANGTEVIIPSKHTDAELQLAKSLASEISKALTTKLRSGKIIHAGVKAEDETAHGRIAILSQPWQPTNVLLEICFLSNYDDMSKYFNAKQHLVHRLSSAISAFASGR